MNNASVTHIHSGEVQPHGPMDLTNLVGEFEAQKSKIDAANRELDLLHKAITTHPEVTAKATKKGNHSITKRLTVTIKESGKWDQEKLAELAEVIDAKYFPFKIERKADAEKLKVLGELHPELALKILVALTTKPAKTEIKIKAVGA